MTESYQADPRTIRELLKEAPLRVPDYQRGFAWKIAQVKEFWSDVKDFAEGNPRSADRYFLGSIVLVERQASSQVIDGQQRLATITMVLAAIRDLLSAEGGGWATEANQLQEEFIVGKQFRRRRAFRFDMSPRDRDLFRRKIQEIGGGGLNLPERFESHKRINSANAAIVKEASTYRGSEEAGLKRLDRLATVLLDNVSVIRCSSTNYVAAATVFETLNSRGIVLSTSELIRSWTMSNAKNEAERSQIADSWESILSIHEVANVDDFIRHFWVAKHGDVKGSRLYKFIREHPDMKNVSPVKFSRELEDAAAVYGDLAGSRTRQRDADRHLRAIKIIGAKALYPALLNLWQSTEGRDWRVRRDFTQNLLDLYVRHILIGGRDNSELEQTAFRIAGYLRTMDRSTALKAARADIRDIAPDDHVFQRDFAETSIASMSSAAYVLRELEQHRRPRRELSVADPDQVHVEHIYPVSPVRSRRWENHDKLINRIGNLTPLSAPINSRLKNDRFAKKKPEYKKSDLLITRDLARRRTWTPEAVVDRQKTLAKPVAEIWPLP